MSRIHDALRRGRAPAQPSPGGRTAHADSVLAALGYKSDHPRRPNTGIVLGVVLFAAVAVGVWYMLPTAFAPTAAAPVTPRGLTHTEPPAVSEVRKPTESNPPPSQPVTAVHTEPAPPPKPAPIAPPVAPPPDLSPRGPIHPVRSTARPMPAPPPAPVNPPAAPEPDEFKLALYYQRTGDFEQALVHYKTVLQRDEMNADAHNNVGNLYMSKALYDDAAREFRRVVAIEPKYVTAHVNLSAAQYQMKRYDESAAEARAAIRLDGHNGDAYVNLALAQAAAGQTSDARSSLIRALEIDKHNAAAHYNLALQYEKSGEVAMALDHYRAFLQYAGPEQAAYAADVRSRIQALENK